GLEVRIGAHSHGQGMETTMAQVANEILGVPVPRIRVVHGDTGLTPYSTGTYASRSMVMNGGAVARAAQALLPRIRKIGAHLLCQPEDAVVLEGGKVRAGDSEATLAQIAHAWYVNPQQLPADVDPAGLEATMGYKPR